MAVRDLIPWGRNRSSVPSTYQSEEVSPFLTLHRGIATRSFKQTFNLADHVKVTGASMENGLLTVKLKREVPEELKPRRIAITSGNGQKAVPHEKSKQIEHEPQQASKAA